jgi:hypothetical protein
MIACRAQPDSFGYSKDSPPRRLSVFGENRLRLTLSMPVSSMEEFSQRAIVAFMLLLPAIAAASLLWMIYERVFANRKSRRAGASSRGRRLPWNTASRRPLSGRHKSARR